MKQTANLFRRKGIQAALKGSVFPTGTAIAVLIATTFYFSEPVGQVNAAQSELAPPSGFMQPGTPYLFDEVMAFRNANGEVATGYTGEPFNTLNHPFFKPGPNGRACVTCHQPQDGMSVSVKTIQNRWDATRGKGALFSAEDGSNCPSLPQGEKASHSLLLEQGLFRIPMSWPPKRLDGSVIEPEFTIEVVSDPTGCNVDPDYGIEAGYVSVFRRPRPAANMRYILSGRTTFNVKTMSPLERNPLNNEHSPMAVMSDARAPSLAEQAIDASGKHMGMSRATNQGIHAGLASLTEQELATIVDFEHKIHTAQNASNVVGSFDQPNTPKALGIKAMMYGQAGRNGNDRDTGTFFFFDEWKAKEGADTEELSEQAQFKASVARGYDIFFLQPLWIRDTAGLNNLTLGNPYKQTCAFCHATQLIGGDQNPGWMDIGTNTVPHALPSMSKKLPTFKITCNQEAEPHPYVGRVIYTHDPGRALVSGVCKDVGGLVMQQFRGLSARAPYFNNGSAQSLREVVDFYDRRFNIGFSDQEKLDLINFLSVL